MNQAHQVVRQDARDAPRDADVTMVEEKPDRTLVAPLNSVSYTGLEEPLEAKAADLYVSAAACVSPHPSFSNYLTVELTVLQEMSRELAELFGLTLPIPFKRQASQTAGYRLATAQPGGSLDLLPERDDISVW